MAYKEQVHLENLFVCNCRHRIIESLRFVIFKVFSKSKHNLTMLP